MRKRIVPTGTNNLEIPLAMTNTREPTSHVWTSKSGKAFLGTKMIMATRPPGVVESNHVTNKWGSQNILLNYTWSPCVIHRRYGPHPSRSGNEQHQDSAKWRRLFWHRWHARGFLFQWHFWRPQIGSIALLFKFAKVFIVIKTWCCYIFINCNNAPAI